MAYPSWSTFPGYSLYPGEGEDVAIRDTVALPAETLEQLLAGHRRVIARVTAELDGRVVDVPVLSGSVSESWDATPRTTGTLSVAATGEWIPTHKGSLLDPRAGTRFRVAFAISGPRTPATMFAYGVFVATGVSVGRESISVTLADLSHVVRGRLMTGPMVVHPGLDPLEQAGRLLARRAPWVRIHSGATGLPLTSEWLSGDVGGDPWEAAEKVAKAASAILYFDEDGLLRMPKVTDPLLAPVAATWETGPDSVLADVDRSLDGVDMPEAIIVKYWRGMVVVPEDTGGRLCVWEGDPETIATDEQARTVGEADLALRRGAVESVTVKAWPRYGLHAGDVVKITDPGTGTATTARITKLDVPLSGEAMNLTLADRRVS